MYVCVCNAVTDSNIRNAVDDGVSDMKQLRQKTDCGVTCGSCNDMAVKVLQHALNAKRESQYLLSIMQPA